jgi:Uri superfamily endonuclease
MNNEQMTNERGSYVLLLELKRPRVIEVGRLGEIRFPIGLYAYAGSAFGPGGLRSRLGRHLRGDGTPHWHIDYLRAKARVVNCFYTVSDTSLECVWSQALATLPGAAIPAPGFGASDCHSGCEAHLIALPRPVNVSNVRRVLEAVALSTVVVVQPR